MPPSNWQTARLGDLAHLRKGVSYQGAYLDQPGPRLLGLGTVAPGGGIKLAEARTYAGRINDNQRIKPGELLIALTDITQDGRILGSPSVLPSTVQGDFAVTHHVARVEITDSEKLDTRFLFYLLQSHAAREYMRGVATGTTVRAVSLKDAEAFSAVFPPVAEQRAIAHILGSLDDKIELNRRMNETLESIAQALFKSWFIDFDPVRTKSEGRDPGLPPHLADLFPDSLEDSELGEIPTGWRAGSVYEIAEVVYGAPFSSAFFNTERAGEPLLRIRDLATESPGVWTTERLDRGYRVQPGDIVVGMDGEFRAYVWGGTPAWLNQRLCAFRPNEGYSAAFVRGAITALLAEVEATETATTVIHLGKGDIDDFRVVVPPLHVVEALNAVGRLAYDRLVLAKQEGRILAAMRDVLLPRLLSGDVRRVAVPSVAGA